MALWSTAGLGGEPRRDWRRRAAGCCVLAAALGGTGSAAAEFNLHEIAPGVYVHQGMQVALDDPAHDDIANIGFITGDRCVAVIDTGGSIRIGTALRDAIRHTTDKPVCYVINTHEHFDHLLGNAAFRADKPHFVGHADLPDAVAASRDYFLDHYRADLGNGAGPESIIAPDTKVADHLALDLGGRKLTLTAYAAAHSHSDLTIMDEASGTLWLGDLLFVDRIPALDGSLLGWLKVLDTLRGIHAARVVPGHGPPSASWPAAATPEIAYLEDLRDEVRADLAKGVFLEDAVDSVGQGQRSRWLLFDEQQGRNVTHAFTELEWE